MLCSRLRRQPIKQSSWVISNRVPVLSFLLIAFSESGRVFGRKETDIFIHPLLLEWVDLFIQGSSRAFCYSPSPAQQHPLNPKELLPKRAHEKRIPIIDNVVGVPRSL